MPTLDRITIFPIMAGRDRSCGSRSQAVGMGVLLLE
jgi:hypothetical protein